MVYLPAKAALRSISSPATLVRYMAWQPGEGEVVACATSKGGRILGTEQSETGVKKFGTDTDTRYLTWSSAGDLLATMGEEAVIWNSNGIRLATLKSELPNDLRPPMKFNGSGRLLVVVRNSLHTNGFNVFDVLTGHCQQFVETDFREDFPIVWKNELEFFFPAGTTIVEWRFGQEGPLQILTGHEASFPFAMAIARAVTSLAFNSSSGLLASGGQDCTVRLWNSEEASPSLATLTTDTSVQDVVWHPLNPRVLASVGGFGQVILWDTETKSTLHIFEGIFEGMDLLNFHSFINWISFSPDGRHLAILGENVVVRRVNTGEIAAVCEGDKVVAASWSPNGNKLAVKCVDDSGSVFNLQNVVEINLQVLSLLQVASCLNKNIKNGDYDKEEVLKKLDIPQKIISEVRQHLD